MCRGQQHMLMLRFACCAQGRPWEPSSTSLLQLGFREVGSAFRLESLSRVERTIASDIAQLGLLMPFM